MMIRRLAQMLSSPIAAILMLAAASPAIAAGQPSVNLGLTSFLDGVAPAGPGWYYQGYLQQYQINAVNDGAGKAAMTPAGKVTGNATVMVNQILYLAPQKLFGTASPGIDVLLPTLLSASLSPSPYVSAKAGVGDMLIGPFLQWDPIISDGRPIFAQRVELQINVPTGAYNRLKNVNPGNNALSLDPYWAGTLFWTPEFTTSVRAHYLWNAKNTATGLQPGQAIHVNFATEYAVTPQWRVGLSGYVFEQITDDIQSGHSVPGSKTQLVGIGPGTVYSFSQNDHIFFNTYFEVAAKNGSEGNRFLARWTHHF